MIPLDPFVPNTVYSFSNKRVLLVNSLPYLCICFSIPSFLLNIGNISVESFLSIFRKGIFRIYLARRFLLINNVGLVKGFQKTRSFLINYKTMVSGKKETENSKQCFNLFNTSINCAAGIYLFTFNNKKHSNKC